ncbi:MAG: hypothetical protein GJ677_05915 [Rhodobacteraceae bacterium]|nr:hypothetical protein [Paracoccaceae bacterium]
MNWVSVSASPKRVKHAHVIAPKTNFLHIGYGFMPGEPDGTAQATRPGTDK